MPPQIKIHDELVGPIRKALREGATPRDLANQYGVDLKTVYRFMKRFSIPVGHRIGTGKEARL